MAIVCGGDGGGGSDGDVVFNHHNPALPQDYAHFRRAVARFLAQLKAPGHKLLLLVCKRALVRAGANVAVSCRCMRSMVGKRQLMHVI
jgi:hypothetical protein